MKISDDIKTLALHSELISSILLKKEITLDNTTYEAMTQCQVKGFIERVLRLKPTKKSAALAFGECFHLALENFYKGTPRDEAIDKAIERANELKLDDLEDEKRNTFSLKELLRFYFFDEDDNPIKLASFNGKHVVELGFKFKLGEITLTIGGVSHKITVYWSGKLDLIASDENGIWGLDHKTTSIMGPQFATDKERSSQMLGYDWTIYQFLDSIGFAKEFRGMKINAVCQRKTGSDRKVFSLPISKLQIDEWQEEALLTIKNTFSQLLRSIDLGVLLPTRTSCVTKYGPCPHYDVCKLPQHAREATLADKNCYEADTWTPLKDD